MSSKTASNDEYLIVLMLHILRSTHLHARQCLLTICTKYCGSYLEACKNRCIRLRRYRAYGPMYRGRYPRPVDERERYYEHERGYERERERGGYERPPHYDERAMVPDDVSYHKVGFIWTSHL